MAGLAGLASHSMAAPGLFTSVQFIDKDNPTSILWIAAVMAISVVALPDDVVIFAEDILLKKMKLIWLRQLALS